MKIDKLIEKTTEKDGVKKWKVVAGIVVSLILVLSIYLGVYYIADVETYINETKDSPHLSDFYDAKKGSNENSVYFRGSSIVG